MSLEKMRCGMVYCGCEPESYIYCGLSCEVSKEDIRKRIENNTITDVLNKVLVQQGD